jgi:hypothetical protein
MTSRFHLLMCFAFAVVSCAANHPADGPPELSGEDFISRFFEPEHMQECVSAIDSLKVVASNQVYSSRQEMLAATDPPTATTTLGVRFVYTINEQDNGFAHQASVYRPPHLPVIYAQILVGLVCARTGLSVPASITASQVWAFHSSWLLNREDHGSLQSVWPIVETVSVEDALKEALLSSNRIELDVQKAEEP